MTQPRNVYEAVQFNQGHFEPDEELEFEPTDAPAGTYEKLSILRARMEAGLPLYHPDDNVPVAEIGERTTGAIAAGERDKATQGIRHRRRGGIGSSDG